MGYYLPGVGNIGTPEQANYSLYGKQPESRPSWDVSGQTPVSTPSGTTYVNYNGAGTSGVSAPGSTGNGITPYSTTSGGGGGGYSYGGGGGGGGGASMDQGMFDAMARLIGASGPEDLEFNRYKRRPFYDFNANQYKRAGKQIRKGTQKDLQQNRQATKNARQQMKGQPNPYAGGTRAQSEDLSNSMSRMLAANSGAGADAAANVSAEGVQADAAMGNVASMLAANDTRRQQSDMRALNADARTSAQNIRAQGRGMRFANQQAKMQARELYQKERWMYGEQVAMMNWQRRNQVADQNVGNQNNWNASVLAPIMQLMGMKPDADPAELYAILGLEPPAA